ncbi:MAG: galactokinase [Candidatus Marinimicrobia bacterium]|nr:galactokinase [Candidatus Neomarinimicrobiota bacterium]
MKISPSQIWQMVENQGKGELFCDIYGVTKVNQNPLMRIVELIDKIEDGPLMLYSAPGRTELGGNHTDHNNGKVLCAAVRQDTLAAVRPNQSDEVIVYSEGFKSPFRVGVNNLNIQTNEKGSTTSLIRGVLAGIKRRGGKVSGFEAWITSTVGIGSGLSSSASFEVLIGTIVSHYYNKGSLSAEEIAQIGQFSENEYFGKPCGLMDQSASALGGILEIDFKNPDSIITQKLNFDIDMSEYQLVIVNVGSDHTDLTPEYAAIPAEMKSIAREYGVDVLRQLTIDDILTNLSKLKQEYGDRALLRTIHFFNENNRVESMTDALKNSDFNRYLHIVESSGISSQTLLQNTIPSVSNGVEQSMALALGVSRHFFEERNRGVARVHGGGFAGTIQAYIHKDDFADYSDLIRSIFGKNTIENLVFRNSGACHLLNITE